MMCSHCQIKRLLHGYQNIITDNFNSMNQQLNGYEQAFLPVLHHNIDVVHRVTWGHLALVKNKKYSGQILFAVSEWNSIGTCLIKTVFDKGMEDSPWLFQSLQQFIHAQGLLPGFYKWDGFIKNYKFTGYIVGINI